MEADTDHYNPVTAGQAPPPRASSVEGPAPAAAAASADGGRGGEHEESAPPRSSQSGHDDHDHAHAQPPPPKKTKGKKGGKKKIDGIPVAPGLPSTLHFESWYYVSNERHNMHIDFHINEDIFEVTLDDDPNPFTLVVVGRDGLPLKLWDLHIGAVLDIMGKPTTLKRCGQTTLKWLDAQARLLAKEIARLEERLHKFSSVKLKVNNPMDNQPQIGTLGGKVRLRALVAVIDRVKAEIKKALS